MDPERMKAAYARLKLLDDRLTYKVRPRRGGGMVRPSVDQIEERVVDLAAYTVELRAIVEEIVTALGSRPKETGKPGA